MLPLFYFAIVSAFFLSLGLAGIISSRHFIIVILSVELIFIASIVALVSYFTTSNIVDGSFFIILVSIWSVASIDIIGLVTFYVYMKRKVVDFNLKELTGLRG